MDNIDKITTEGLELHKFFVRQSFSRPKMSESHTRKGATWLRSNIQFDASGESVTSRSIAQHLKSLNAFIAKYKVPGVSKFDVTLFSETKRKLSRCLKECYDREELTEVFGREFKDFKDVTFGDLHSGGPDENLLVVLKALETLGTKSRPLLEYASLRGRCQSRSLRLISPYEFEHCLIPKDERNPGLNFGVTSVGGFGTVSLKLRNFLLRTGFNDFSPIFFFSFPYGRFSRSQCRSGIFQ